MLKTFFLFIFLSFPTFAKVDEIMRPPFYERCVKSICGDKWESPVDILRKRTISYVVTAKDPDILDAQGNARLGQILAKLELLTKQERQEFLHRYKQFQSLPISEEIASLTLDQKILVTTVLFVLSSNVTFISQVNTSKKEIVFDQQKIEELSSKLGDLRLTKAIQQILFYLYPYFFIEITSHPASIEIFLAEKFPEKQHGEEIESLFFDYQNERRAFHSLYPSLRLEEYLPEKSKPQNIFETKNLVEDLLFLVQLGKILQDQTIKEIVATLDFQHVFHKYVELMGWHDQVGKIPSRINELALSNAEFGIKYIMNKYFTQSYLILPKTVAEKIQLKEKAGKIVEELIGKIEKLFPGEPRLYHVLHGIQLVLPPTQLEYTQRLLSEIERELLPSPSDKEPALDKILSFQFLEKMHTTDLEFFQPSAYDILFERKISNYESINDSALGKYVTVSLLSLYSDYGAAILAHEVGHVVDSHRDLLTQPENQRRYKEVLACLNGLHPEQAETTEISFHGESIFRGFYAEEDFADLISDKVFEKRKGVNVSCGSIDSMKPDPLINSDASDPHSSHLYRILHTETVKSGTVTSQCKEYLQNFEKNETARRIENCWK